MSQAQDNEITVQERSPQPVLSTRATVPLARLATTQGEALQALWNHLRHQDAKPLGPPFVRYHTFGEVDADVEVGVAVAEGVAGEAPVAVGELPGGRVVSAAHPADHLSHPPCQVPDRIRRHV